MPIPTLKATFDLSLPDTPSGTVRSLKGLLSTFADTPLSVGRRELASPRGHGVAQPANVA